MKSLNINDVVRCFDSGTIKRGQSYFAENRIAYFEPFEYEDQIDLEAEVRGSRQIPYDVSIEIYDDGHQTRIESICSCPVRLQCKHAVAVCFHYLAMQKAPKTPAPPQSKQWLNSVTKKVIHLNQPPKPDEPFIHFYISIKSEHRPVLTLKKHKFLKNGNVNKGTKLSLENFISPYYSYSSELTPDDKLISQLIFSQREGYAYTSFSFQGELGCLLLKKFAHSKRCFVNESQDALQFNETPIKLQFEWQTDKDKNFWLENNLPSGCMILNTKPMCVIDLKTNQVQVLETQASNDTIYNFLDAPPFKANELNEILPELMALPDIPEIKLPDHTNNIDLKTDPIPHVELPQQFPQIPPQLKFQYDQHMLIPIIQEEKAMVFDTDQCTIIHRNLEKETAYVKDLQSFELDCFIEDEVIEIFPKNISNFHEMMIYWGNFIKNHVPKLKEKGWVFSQIPNWENLVANDTNLTIQNDENDGWFSLSFNVNINGQTMPLVPLITDILDGIDDLDELPEKIYFATGENKYTELQTNAIKPIIGTLKELYDQKNNHELKVQRFDAHLLDEDLLDNDLITWKGSQEILQLSKKLKQFQGIEAVKQPDALTTELRDYQKTGLNWLNFLHQYKFSGILADDMGLGKTIQTLSHLSRLKESGSLPNPSLIVVPTSLIANWKNEIKRFTPNLKPLIYYGLDRHELNDQIKESDVVVTSYALTVRDTEVHLEHQYEYIILDEAQKIKNPKTKMAKALCQFKSNHRLALSGTPIENHLGELWSIFNFLMPGFLKNSAQFQSFYQKPIEKEFDEYKKDLLNKRIKPFILRRKKEDVLAELPAKTEIIKRTQFSNNQAKLYESIRISMDKKVREAIAEKGVNRSHITMLDALLKLRQVCCHPELLKLKQAKKVKESAKLELFITLLDELLEEGHKVLVFSQFTSMLKVLEATLQNKKIKYTKLTGATRKREQVIERFTSGKADVFLISLKAGGVGLNLTEADTVIHYDPWWNPAVENQATDRAHRIGQDKAVFVYKLIVENSIEEKIIELQNKKEQLQKAIYDKQQGKAQQTISADDLLSLFSDES